MVFAYFNTDKVSAKYKNKFEINDIIYNVSSSKYIREISEITGGIKLIPSAYIETFELFKKWLDSFDMLNVLDDKINKIYEHIKINHDNINIIHNPNIFKNTSIKCLRDMYKFGCNNLINILCNTVVYVIATRNIIIGNKICTNGHNVFYIRDEDTNLHYIIDECLANAIIKNMSIKTYKNSCYCCPDIRKLFKYKHSVIIPYVHDFITNKIIIVDNINKTFKLNVIYNDYENYMSTLIIPYNASDKYYTTKLDDMYDKIIIAKNINY